MQDEFAGQGGSYIIDPETGKRKRVSVMTAPAPDAAAAPDVVGAGLLPAHDADAPADVAADTAKTTRRK